MSPSPLDRVSLRHYLIKERKIGEKLSAEIILAEEANQLYRDSSYEDLITFEEDIAKISAMVLLIAESPGSLAELGAFVSPEHLRSKLCLIIQSRFQDTESFIRYGPVKRLQDEESERVGFFPWETTGKGKVIKQSVDDSYPDILAFIQGHLNRVSKSHRLGAKENRHLRPFALILWLTYLAQGITVQMLQKYLGFVGVTLTHDEVSDCVYCMRLAGWLDRERYSGSAYIYCKREFDPMIRYAFAEDSPERDKERWQADTQQQFVRELQLPRGLRKRLPELRLK